MMDDIVIMQLTPMFPQLTPEVIRLSVEHVSNRGEPLNEGYLLQRCIDDLLELRTYSLETTFEGPQDGSREGDVLVTGVQPGNIHCRQDIILISDSPMQDYSTVLSPPSAGETCSDHQLTVDTSHVPMVTDDTVSDQIPSVSHRPTHNEKHGQSTSGLSGKDTDLPDIMPPKARHLSSTVSSAVTHSATLPSYFPSAVSHTAPSTSYTPTAATHNASASTYHTPVANTNNASTYHTPAAATHNAPASTYEMPTFETQKKPIRTLERPTPRLPVTDAVTPTFETQKKPIRTLERPTPRLPVTDASTPTFETQKKPIRTLERPTPRLPVTDSSTPTFDTQKKTIRTLVGPTPRLPVTDTSTPTFETQKKPIRTLVGPTPRVPVTDSSTPTFDTQKKTIQTSVALSPGTGKQEHASASATTATMSSASTSEKTTASSASMAVVNTVPLASAGTVVVKTEPLPSTSMACAKTIPLASADVTFAKSVPLASTSTAGAKTIPSGMAGPNTVPSASSSTAGTANVTVPPASSGTAGVPTPDVKLGQQETEIPGTVPLVEPSTSQAQPKSREEKLEELTQEVCCVFTDADRDYVKDLMRHSFYPDPVNAICNYMLEENNYLRVKKPDAIPLPGPSLPPTSPLQSTVTRTSDIDYYDDTQHVSDLYRSTCISRLQYEFRKISYRTIYTVASHFGFHYTPTRHALTEAERCLALKDHTTLELVDSSGHVAKLGVVHLKGKRKYKTPVDASCCPELLAEVLCVRQESSGEQKTVDKPGDVSVSEDLFQDTDATIECGCCYDDCRFEDMVQCSDGHLFCRKCVESYTRESVFGQGQANLVCMTDSCDATFPKSQLEVALPVDLLSQFESRMQEEAINMAAMTDLVRCPHCDFAAILDLGDKVFRCMQCQKETCRYCKEDWAEHIGIPCVELEKKDETKIRLAFEEKMTEAKIRVCHRCKARFTKLDGCNKMTCRCGAKMCYICRKPDIDYIHFCQHVRDPGRGCKKCKDCSLWTNPDEDEERAIVELKKEAQVARKEQGYTDDKMIGASFSPVKKKRRVER